MSNNIVFLNVSVTEAPAPSTLQQTGAFISQGGTTNATNSLTLLTSLSALSGMLATPLALTSLTWSGGLVTATTTAAHGLTTSSVYQLTIAGSIATTTPGGYNGNFACTITGTSTFTYSVASNPGTASTPGTWTPTSTVELVAMATTWFAQTGIALGINILELGKTTTAAATAALGTYLGNNTGTIYALLVPRAWDAASGFLTLIQSYESPTSQLYFFTTTTNATYSNYTALMKCVYAKIEAPAVNPNTEFSCAADLYQVLQQRPSSTNKVAPLAFRFVYGVTPYPVPGNGALFTAWKAAGINWVGTGYEGGISTAIIFWGTTMDLNPFNYWYGIDWLEINADLNAANAVINGSNNPINPLYLNQDGINRVQAVLASTCSSGVTFGMFVGTVTQTELDGPTFDAALSAGTYAGNVVVNAIPFVAYYTANPDDYATGTYNGYSITLTPLRGFTSITININVSNFVAP